MRTAIVLGLLAVFAVLAVSAKRIRIPDHSVRDHRVIPHEVNDMNTFHRVYLFLVSAVQAM